LLKFPDGILLDINGARLPEALNNEPVSSEGTLLEALNCLGFGNSWKSHGENDAGPDRRARNEFPRSQLPE
jgi:hypothetical protein